MLKREDKKNIRHKIFNHLDGIVLSYVISVLHDVGIIKYILKKKRFNLEEISKKYNANIAYLNVALRLLASQGCLTYNLDNNKSVVLLELKKKELLLHSSEYSFFIDFIKKVDFINVFFSNNTNVKVNAVLNRLLKLGSQRVKNHIEGLLLSPLLVKLAMDKSFRMINEVNPSFYQKNTNLNKAGFYFLTSILKDMGYLTEDNCFTAEGLFYIKRTSSFGVTVSYIPTFLKLHELIFGNSNILWEVEEGEDEIHLDRVMNVWGSGGAHSIYFKKTDEFIISIFNKPIEDQPKGFVDVGCGNGTFIKHIFDTIYYKTKRGKLLDKNPLFVLGVDFNNAALLSAKKTLKNADIWAEFEIGDISNPDALNSLIKKKYDIGLGDLLNVRSFLDHNRIYERPDNIFLKSTSTGAFAFRGKLIPNNTLFQNLVEHFKKWTPYLEKYGLLLLELHTLPPDLTANNIGKTVAIAYDATHGFSDQYIVELNEFLRAAKKANLYPDDKFKATFPNSILPTISINLLLSK